VERKKEKEKEKNDRKGFLIVKINGRR